jgi:hypothetical protein
LRFTIHGTQLGKGIHLAAAGIRIVAAQIEAHLFGAAAGMWSARNSAISS